MLDGYEERCSNDCGTAPSAIQKEVCIVRCGHERMCRANLRPVNEGHDVRTVANLVGNEPLSTSIHNATIQTSTATVHLQIIDPCRRWHNTLQAAASLFTRAQALARAGTASGGARRRKNGVQRVCALCGRRFEKRQYYITRRFETVLGGCNRSIFRTPLPTLCCVNATLRVCYIKET